MSRKRSHDYRRARKGSGPERSYHAYQVDVPSQAITRPEIIRLLRGGEDTYLELKVRLGNSEKLIAEIVALANTAGGAIIFGVNDQLRIEGVDDPEDVEQELRRICREQIQPPVFPYIRKVAFDSGRRIVILEVDTENRPHRTLDDRFYVREGSHKREAAREELSRIYQDNRLVRFEQVPVFQSDLREDVDESLFWSYIRSVNPGYWGETSKGFPTDAVMLDMGLAERLGEETVPNVGGLLLFGFNERIGGLLPQAMVTLSRLSGNEPGAPVVERIELHGNLLRLHDGALNFIRRYVDLWDARPSRKAREQGGGDGDEAAEPIGGRANYHRGAMIEALANSLIHRDWSVRDRGARINVFDDSIEIVNPSQLPELPLVSVRYGMALAPNPRIKAVFTSGHYGVEAAGRGIPMIFSASIGLARRAPDGPSITGNDFRIRIHGLR